MPGLLLDGLLCRAANGGLRDEPGPKRVAPNDAGFFPIVAAHFFTTRQMTLSESRVGNGLFHLFTPRKSGPA